MRTPTWTFAAFALFLAAGCGGGNTPAMEAPPPGTMEVTATGLSFDAPEEVASGWVTVRFHNRSAMTHFALVERLPAGIGVKEQQEQVAPPFQEGMNLLNAGEPEAAMKAFGTLPDWFGQIVFMGGPGLTGPGHTSEATVYLEPGTYMLECYVKTNGVFHSYNPDSLAFGMVHQFVVTEAPSGAAEPVADLEMTLSSTRGIEITGEPTPGRHVVAVHFEDQKVYENFVRHDVHLVHLAGDTDMDTLVAWMDWMAKTGLQTPAPAEFVGGLNEMPAGTTAYMTVDLEPGHYAWISEVPHADQKNLLKPFVVRIAADAGS